MDYKKLKAQIYDALGCGVKSTVSLWDLAEHVIYIINTYQTKKKKKKETV